MKASDISAFHHYPSTLLGFPSAPIREHVRLRVAELQKAGVSAQRPVWMTEGSPVSDQLQSGIYRHTLPYKSEEDGWIPRIVSLASC